MEYIFLIEKIWTDPMENQIGSAVGYNPHGFVETEEQAKEFCSKGRTYTQNDCWAIRGERTEFRYEKIKRLI